MTHVFDAKDPVILAMQSGNNKNIHAAIKEAEFTCELMQNYIRFAMTRMDSFAIYQLIKRIPADRISSDFVGSPLVSEIIHEACLHYKTAQSQPAVKAVALQVIALLTSALDHQKKPCFTKEQVTAYFKAVEITDVEPGILQKRARYHRVIFGAEDLSLRIESDKRFDRYQIEQYRLKCALMAFVSEMNKYNNSASDADLNNENRYIARITSIENFLETVEKAYPNQSPNVFVVTVQNSLAEARATIREDVGNQSTVRWIIDRAVYGISRASTALTNVERVLNTTAVNDATVVSCRQEEYQCTGTERNGFINRGY